MKRLLSFIALMTISATSAFAQDKQHSLEITTGYPSILHIVLKRPDCQCREQLKPKNARHMDDMCGSIYLAPSLSFIKNNNLQSAIGLTGTA